MVARWKSDAQANAEAVARRERGYGIEHATSARRAAVRSIPVGLDAMLRGFLRAWESEIKGRLHGQGVEWETPGRIERADGTGVTDPGGGNALGSPRYDAETRAHLFGRPNRTDADGMYVAPMHWTVEWLRQRHPLKAALLRLIGLGGDWRTQVSVSCPACQHSVTLPDEYAEAVARDALGLAFRYLQDAPGGGVGRAA